MEGHSFDERDLHQESLPGGSFLHSSVVEHLCEVLLAQSEHEGAFSADHVEGVGVVSFEALLTK